jgi:hypothetical protein
VKLGVATWIGYGPIYCAAANGYYKKYGLDVKLINFSDNALMAGAVRNLTIAPLRMKQKRRTVSELVESIPHRPVRWS